jgi:hypothetical protein
MGRASSLAWKSIFKARDLLEGGLRWRVGNGESIKIWGDRWLPSQATFRVQSPVDTLDHNARVCSLMNQDTGWWDVPLVRTIFNTKEAEIICGLPLNFLCQPGTLIWARTSQGIFTVRNAYGEQEISGVWTTLWSLKVSGALKLILWKVCNNALPTKENLYRRKITKDPMCPIYETKA